jgi:ABC-2 type transport system ATP-binding protein
VRRHVGVLPESAGYPARQAGSELLRYLARLHGRSRASAAATAERLLDQVGLAAHGSVPIGSYSRGMRQRLGIAAALVNDPAVVFFDEPTLGLDPAGQRQVLDLLRAMAGERGATVVLSTHFLAEVEEVCARVLILNRGRLVAAGTVAEVAARAAAPRRGRCRVPAAQRERAVGVLAAAPGARGAEAEGREWAVVTLEDGNDAGPALAALAAAEIPLLAYELEGARLSDAFLSLTGGT